jgi:hypothetical protein
MRCLVNVKKKKKKKSIRPEEGRRKKKKKKRMEDSPTKKIYPFFSSAIFLLPRTAALGDRTVQFIL